MRWIRSNGRWIPAVVFLLLWTFSSVPSARAAAVRDWNNDKDPLQSAIGLHYGNLGGHGLSFRVPINWWLYAQVGGGIWHTSDNERHNLGLQLNYILRQDDRLRLYLGGGLGYFYHREKIDSSGGEDLWVKNKDWNLGAGVGMEYLLGPRWALQGELDFAHKSKDDSITVIPQVGIHFYW